MKMTPMLLVLIACLASQLVSQTIPPNPNNCPCPTPAPKKVVPVRKTVRVPAPPPKPAGGNINIDVKVEAPPAPQIVQAPAPPQQQTPSVFEQFMMTQMAAQKNDLQVRESETARLREMEQARQEDNAKLLAEMQKSNSLMEQQLSAIQTIQNQGKPSKVQTAIGLLNFGINGANAFFNYNNMKNTRHIRNSLATGLNMQMQGMPGDGRGGNGNLQQQNQMQRQPVINILNDIKTYGGNGGIGKGGTGNGGTGGITMPPPPKDHH